MEKKMETTGNIRGYIGVISTFHPNILTPVISRCLSEVDYCPGIGEQALCPEGPEATEVEVPQEGLQSKCRTPHPRPNIFFRRARAPCAN